MSADGRHLLILPGDATELVDPGLDPEELAGLYGLDEVVRAPKVNICAATYLDGPLADTAAGYATNEIGSRVGFALPPRPGGQSGTYEVVRLAEGDRPAELRLVELD
ncbi:hypothetical protein ACEZDB_12065 [Streptacidiphilus sp. N1-3]|uniref:Uncharacterized protein n=1 Tax=Streptacidiphilus alkalitolerans TaxID=3342712 RepID=A0ABV6WZD5_9ACTN